MSASELLTYCIASAAIAVLGWWLTRKAEQLRNRPALAELSSSDPKVLEDARYAQAERNRKEDRSVWILRLMTVATFWQAIRTGSAVWFNARHPNNGQTVHAIINPILVVVPGANAGTAGVYVLAALPFACLGMVAVVLKYKNNPPKAPRMRRPRSPKAPRPLVSDERDYGSMGARTSTVYAPGIERH